jgi:hypothetical protein
VLPCPSPRDASLPASQSAVCAFDVPGWWAAGESGGCGSAWSAKEEVDGGMRTWTSSKFESAMARHAHIPAHAHACACMHTRMHAHACAYTILVHERKLAQRRHKTQTPRPIQQHPSDQLTYEMSARGWKSQLQSVHSSLPFESRFALLRGLAGLGALSVESPECPSVVRKLDPITWLSSMPPALEQNCEP